MSSAVSALPVSPLAPSTARGSGTSTQQALSVAPANSGFGVSVSIAISVAATTQTTTPATQDGAQALATLQQSLQSVREQNKQDAAAKLDEAVKELSLLKLLGNTVAGAREAVKLAKQIASAVKEYTAAGGTPPASAISAAATGLSQAHAAAPIQQDPFYAIAGAALSIVQKFLKKALPSLQNSPDPAVRAEARKLTREFQKALSSLDGSNSDTSQDADSTIAAPGDTSATTVVVAASASISVDLVA